MTDTPWRTVGDAATRAHRGKRLIYSAAKKKELRSAKVGNRLLFLDEWIDTWILSKATGPVVVPMRSEVLTPSTRYAGRRDGE